MGHDSTMEPLQLIDLLLINRWRWRSCAYDDILLFSPLEFPLFLSSLPSIRCFWFLVSFFFFLFFFFSLLSIILILTILDGSWGTCPEQPAYFYTIQYISRPFPSTRLFLLSSKPRRHSHWLLLERCFVDPAWYCWSWAEIHSLFTP